MPGPTQLRSDAAWSFRGLPNGTLTLGTPPSVSPTESRFHKRWRVHLTVRYERAADFVTEYAENLSYGGVFVRDADKLEPLSELTLAIDLPGVETYHVTAKVAHVLTAEMAAAAGCNPGAGLELVNTPPGFSDALSDYLLRLGRRREMGVLVDSELCCRALADSGYNAMQLPPADQLASSIASSKVPIVALVVERGRLAEFSNVTNSVIEYAGPDDLDEIIRKLDERL